jgi:hypothetical protein
MSKALEVIMRATGLSNTQTNLLEFAQTLIRQRGLSPVDRLARRKKPALVCWFCENCPDLMLNPYLNGVQPAFRPTPDADQRQNGIRSQFSLQDPPGPTHFPQQETDQEPSLFMRWSMEDGMTDWFEGAN